MTELTGATDKQIAYGEMSRSRKLPVIQAAAAQMIERGQAAGAPAAVLDTMRGVLGSIESNASAKYWIELMADIEGPNGQRFWTRPDPDYRRVQIALAAIARAA